VPLLATGSATWLALQGASVGFIDDDQFGTGANEILASRFRLDVVHRHDGKWKHLENGSIPAETIEFVCRARQDEFSINVKLVVKLFLPLFRQVRRAEDGQSIDFASIKHFLCDERSFNRFSDADIVRDQKPNWVKLQSHEKRDELVGPRLDSDAPKRPKWTRAGSEPKPNRVAQHAAALIVAKAGRIGQGKPGFFDRFKSSIDARDFGIRSTQRPNDQELVPRIRKYDPFPASNLHQ
jgi:hypothetical protein